MYNQYVAGDLIYSRIYEQDPPPPDAAQEGAQAESPPVDSPTVADAGKEAEKNAGSTGTQEQLRLDGLDREALPLLLLLLLLLRKGTTTHSTPLLAGLLLLGLGNRGG